MDSLSLEGALRRTRAASLRETVVTFNVPEFARVAGDEH
jgi:hypothetical protein